jgi:sugar O-acyltransferase (sialic acid O-acetyltransferase NeuD family)
MEMPSNKEKLVLIGAGGHCKVVIDIANDIYHIYGITDISTEKHGSQFYGINVIGNDDKLRYIYQEGVNNALITLGSVGDSSIREKLFHYARNIGFKMINAISMKAIISESVTFGLGNVIMDGAIIHADCTIFDNTIINTGAIIEHDCKIESHAHISVGAKLGGGVEIGKGSHIGMGASIIQGITVGKNCIIGAGAVVIGHIPDNSTAVGVPARVVRKPQGGMIRDNE